ncbi:MAG: hypothetical protein ABW046_20440 [Actinoplanes sp.]
MTFDPLRCAEAGAQAAIVLGIAVLPNAWSVLDPSLGAILGMMWLVLTGVVYSLHLVTFDCFRLIGRRIR